MFIANAVSGRQITADDIILLMHEYKNGPNRLAVSSGSRPIGIAPPPPGFASKEAYDQWVQIGRPNVPIKTGRNGTICAKDVNVLSSLMYIKGLVRSEFLPAHLMRYTSIGPSDFGPHERSGPLSPSGVRTILTVDVERKNAQKNNTPRPVDKNLLSEIKNYKKTTTIQDSSSSKKRRKTAMDDDNDGYA